MALGERGKRMDSASKVKRAEQVTTNICAIIFFCNCEFCHELAQTVYIIQWGVSQNKHQPTVEKQSGKVSHKVVVIFEKRRFLDASVQKPSSKVSW